MQKELPIRLSLLTTVCDRGDDVNKSTIPTLRRALADLESERNTIDAAIVSLRGLINNISTTPDRAARRGRAVAKTAATRRKRKWTAAARKAVGVRMKKYWNERRKVKTTAN